MEIIIDYIGYSEQAYIIHQDGDNQLWWSLYSHICDYVPSSSVKYSDSSMSMAWQHFIRVKGYVVAFAKAHRDEMKVSLTDIAKKKVKNADSMSYQSAILKPQMEENVIISKLQSCGFERRLTANQLTNLCKIGNLPGAATFSVPGAGKTTEALAFFCLNATSKDKLLIVAPKNAFGAWDEQIEACMPGHYEPIVRLRGGEQNIRKLVSEKPRFSIITYDQLSRVKDVIIELLISDEYFVFLDESHRVKGGRNVKRADTVLEFAHLPKRKLIMSGTPMPQGPKDLLTQFRFLYPSKDVDEINVVELFQPIYVRTTKGQLGIPEIKYRIITVRMNELQRNIYKTLKSETKRQINPMLSDASKYELRAIGKCVMKIMEFVSNPSLLALDMDYAFDHRVGELLLQTDGPKIEYVCKRARELAAEGKKVIIWSCFVQNVELIALRLSDLGAVYIHGGVDAGSEEEEDTREGKIKRFHDDPSCNVLVANPAACSEGISLHKVCQNAIYLDRSFNAAHYLQSEDRIHRLGLAKDAHPVVEFVECENSIDQIIRERLNNKVNIMAQALNDESLSIDMNAIEYDDESDSEDITQADAQAVLDYFFSGVDDD